MAPNKGQALIAVDVQAKVGYLTVVYGDKPQIEIGSKLVDHASVSWDNGTLTYRDDFTDYELSFNDIDSEDYKIAITLPTSLEIKTLSVKVGIGSIALQNIMVDTALLTGTGKINPDGFRSKTLELNSFLADNSAADRDDYAIRSTWKLESGNREPRELLLKSEETGILINMNS